MGIAKIIRLFSPPRRWLLPAVVSCGIAFGLIVFLVYISKAPTYLSDDPKTCVNCHIMAPQYSTWFHSSHRQWASCNDCHVPHNNIINHYYFKGKDGMRHATIFTLRREPQVIFILEPGQKVVKQNCLRCHEALLSDNRLLSYTKNYQHFRNERNCWECHREVPHGRVNSLSSVPNARVPLPESPVPEWMEH